MADWKARLRTWLADFKVWMLALKAPSEIVRVWFPKEAASGEKICTTCSHVGAPIEEMGGRREIELTLWTVFVGIAILFLVNLMIGEFVVDLKWLRLVHGAYRLLKRVGELFVFLSLVYTIFRISTQHEKCSKCNSSTVIPIDSPRAKDLLKGR